MRTLLERIDGRGYPAYRDLVGIWQFDSFELIVDHVQGDPFASPSRVRVRVQGALSERDIRCQDGRIAAEDWLLRRFEQALPSGRRGSGRSGQIQCLRPGPEIEERSAIQILSDGTIEARFRVGLPARGRRVLGRAAWDMFDVDARRCAGQLNGTEGLAEHIASVRLQRGLRRALAGAGLVAFVADGSVLPRASGVDQRPMVDAVPFEAPDSLRVSLTVGEDTVSGLGIPEGVTVIVGGGFHGKSTLLMALQRGHLDHIPGDGRERVVAISDAVKVRAEDGRPVSAVGISSFLRDLPGGRSTVSFSTDDASGSTSQAAAIMEAIESGARLLLLDEDTSATNLMVRDERMRALIPREQEPITPFVERVRQMFETSGISTLMVVGGVGDYLAVADTVVGMVEYRPHDMTQTAKVLALTAPNPPDAFRVADDRTIAASSFKPGKISARDERRIRYNDTDIDLVGVEQVLSGDHAWSIGQAIAQMNRIGPEWQSLVDRLDAIDSLIDDGGIDVLSPRSTPVGDLVRPRRHEVAAALNRIRGLRVQVPDKT